MRKRYILTTLVAMTLIMGTFSVLYANNINKSEDILTLIEEGAIEKENERYMLALQKYNHAMTVIKEELAKDAENTRILLLKELLVSKIEQCRQEIEKIETEIDPSFPYRKALQEAYALIEKADRDKGESRFYVALKKYSKANKKLKLALKNISDWEEAERLLGLKKTVDMKVEKCRESIEKIEKEIKEGIVAEEEVVVEKEEEIVPVEKVEKKIVPLLEKPEVLEKPKPVEKPKAPVVKIKRPAMPRVRIPKIKIPKPRMPEIKLPEVKLPKIKIAFEIKCYIRVGPET